MTLSQEREQASAWTSAFNQGKFVRKSSEFRDVFSLNGPFTPESNRYHLYISHACPWAHRTLLVRTLMGLESHITVDVVDWRMNHDGSWSFNPDEPGATKDSMYDSCSLEEIYQKADENWVRSGKIGTVPVLWDKKLQTIVNNESREIIRMLSDSFGHLCAPSGMNLAPIELREEIDAMIDANYETVNNGVYKSGFARTQDAYEEAVVSLFNRLDELETHLEGRMWLVGQGQGTLTEADVCLFTTLVRFDLVYVVHFKCNLKRIHDYPNLTAFVNRFLSLDGVESTCDWNHIKSHYFWSHTNLNPYRIIPLGPISGPHTKNE
jgi:putative glutathione S-transferase